MKSDIRLQPSVLRLFTAFCAGLMGCVSSGFALNEGNPYVAISGRNVFALKPAPPVVPLNTPPPVAPAGIELQGFTTILGRPQVLIKVKIPPRPPEPAKDRSLVMDVGQREGEVEVLEMNTTAGTVSIKNQGNLLTLNLKDNSSKPTAGPALAAPPVAGAALPPPQLPPPAQALPAPPAARSLPNRQLRTLPNSAPTGAAPAVKNGPTQETMMSAEEQTIIIEALRMKHKDDPNYPPLPPTEFTP